MFERFRIACIMACAVIITSAIQIGMSADAQELGIKEITFDERIVGFAVLKGEREITRITFGSVNNIYAEKVRRSKSNGMRKWRFGPLRSTTAPKLSGDSYVTVMIKGDDPYPQVWFRIGIRRFDRERWEREMGRVPFHFLVCSMPDAKLFHQRGWVIPTPALDSYPLHNEARGYGRQIVSNWSRNWTYAPPIGAYPLATVGLWDPDSGRYIAYDFHAARLIDHTEKDIASAYCWQFKSTREFFTLVYPYGRGYQQLRYPKNGDVIASHFHLLYSFTMTSDNDPNLFVHEFVWARYREYLPSVPIVNDLSWLPQRYRLSAFPKLSVGRLFHRLSEKEARWFKAGALVQRGVNWDGDPVGYIYETGQESIIKQLKQDIEFLLQPQYARRMVINGDECYYWQWPLEGEGIDMFGPGVPTMHNIWGWKVALAMLDVYRH
ncbi:MAG TPA: hypothetical protein EYP10_11235, partial [Armatimonadetes bacterium]|nr:hypothetical protein [Armatimonadota bacterium]